MKLKVKLKSIYRRYKKYVAVWIIILNLVFAALPPYDSGTGMNLFAAAMFCLVLCYERHADLALRWWKADTREAYRIIYRLSDELQEFRKTEHLRKLYSSYRFSAGDQFYYDGAWHDVAYVDYQECLIAYDISTDEDDDLQFVWVRFENIENYKPQCGLAKVRK